MPRARDPDPLVVGGKPGQDGPDADDRERNIDQERQPPAPDGDEQAAERRAGGDGGLPGDGQRAQHAAGTSRFSRQAWCRTIAIAAG